MSSRRQRLAQPHPAAGVLRQRRISNRRVAHLLGYSPGWVGACLLGQVRVPATFRERLAALLSVPEHELFRPEVEVPRHPGDDLIVDGVVVVCDP